MYESEQVTVGVNESKELEKWSKVNENEKRKEEGVKSEEVY